MWDLIDITAPFKLMRTEIAREIVRECKYMNESFWSEFMVRAYKKKFRIIEIPVTHRRRVDNSATRVYMPLKIPKIAMRQLKALAYLVSELELGAI